MWNLILCYLFVFAWTKLHDLISHFIPSKFIIIIYTCIYIYKYIHINYIIIYKKQQPTLHNVFGVDVDFRQHIIDFCTLLLDADFGGQNTGSVGAPCATSCTASVLGRAS